MIPGIAWRNFLGQGLRASLNVTVTAFILIAIVFGLSLINGFYSQALRNLVRTDVAGGHYRVPGFDILTPSEWEDRTRPVPSRLHALAPSEKAEVLVLQGQIFPNRRLFPVQLRGVEMGQTLLDLPLDALHGEASPVTDVIPVIIGEQMARKSGLKPGGLVVMKWRDKHSAVDALDAKVVDVVPFLNPRIDEGVFWMRLDHLRQITDRLDEVTWVAVSGFFEPVEGFEFLPPNTLMRDLLTLWKYDRRSTRVMWIILVMLAAISVFNTQFVSIFKRQKEIGTMLALGMSPRELVALFTLEGSLAAIGSVIIACVLGVPFFAWFQTVGFDVSHLSQTGIPVQEKIFLVFRPYEIASAVLVTVAIMILVAWWPVRRLAKLDPTLALRGRGIT